MLDEAGIRIEELRHITVRRSIRAADPPRYRVRRHDQCVRVIRADQCG
jgi:hypothetical protein